MPSIHLGDLSAALKVPGAEQGFRLTGAARSGTEQGQDHQQQHGAHGRMIGRVHGGTSTAILAYFKLVRKAIKSRNSLLLSIK